MLQKVHYEGTDYANLAACLQANWGHPVEFDNGCTVFLEDDAGVIWRTSPYGVDGGCNYVEGWEDNIREWLTCWDEPRTETGELVKE